MNYVGVDIHKRYSVLNSAVLYETSECTACVGGLICFGLQHGAFNPLASCHVIVLKKA